ncbi:hypothetical protein [Stutzerimonas xanthomarina]|uniref:hypothetical protein n=1 Tax=Stutzerimonas xanthomarina TaxID=271420 RepID=UPI003AA82DF5
MLDLACALRAEGQCRAETCRRIAGRMPSADCVVLNMVLHHLAAPGEAITTGTAGERGGSCRSRNCAAITRVGQEACGDCGWVSNRTIWPVGPMPRGSRPARASTLA